MKNFKMKTVFILGACPAVLLSSLTFAQTSNTPPDNNHVSTQSTYVNEEITDAVTQTNVKVITETPAVPMGTLYQSVGHATRIMHGNSVTPQQGQNAQQQAATHQGIMQIYALDTPDSVDAVIQPYDPLSIMQAVQELNEEELAAKELETHVPQNK